MADCDQDVADAPPTHYIVKLRSFSLLTKNEVEKYTSADFEAGGYTWKLAIYPNGNKTKGVADYMSVYVVMARENFLRPGLEVHAVFRMFLLDQNSDNYLTLQGKARRFRKMKLEWGFDRLVHLKTLNDPSNGYLVNDTCILGVEIYVCKETYTGAKGESLLMIKDAVSHKSTWKIDSFSNLYDSSNLEASNSFVAGEQKWKIQLYPKGKGSGTGNHISLYLALDDPTSLSPGNQMYVEFALRILDQRQGKHYLGKAKHWFSASNPVSGWPRFVSLSYFNQSNNGLLWYDRCTIEAEVTVHGMADAL
ncbi:unnamed protein product [Coffea canephora]|uniref:MATH domain-containing protein n=1 Tax=Coffea canephora TaxID=49390 RepID=A0A068TR70_COFCA|nr:unnamed protein product [Coffea canephora]